LWVEEEMRGSGLGRKLLAAVRNDAALQWGAGFIRLAVYADNPRAVAFYERIGFRTRTGEIGMLLEGEALERIGETAGRPFTTTASARMTRRCSWPMAPACPIPNSRQGSTS